MKYIHTAHSRSYIHTEFSDIFIQEVFKKLGANTACQGKDESLQGKQRTTYVIFEVIFSKGLMIEKEDRNRYQNK